MYYYVAVILKKLKAANLTLFHDFATDNIMSLVHAPATKTA